MKVDFGIHTVEEFAAFCASVYYVCKGIHLVWMKVRKLCKKLLQRVAK